MSVRSFATLPGCPMRGRLPALLVTGLLTLNPAGRAADPAEAAVARLAAPRYAEREKAARELEALGGPALKALRAARSSGDEEVRLRAAGLVAKIEQAERSRRLLAPPKISLMFAQYPLDLAMVEFARETGLRVAYAPTPGADAKRKITLDTGPLPYWEAVHAFYKAAGLAENDLPPPAPSPERLSSPGVRKVVVRSGAVLRSSGIPAPIRLTEGDSTRPAVLDRALRVRALPGAFPGNKYDDAKGELTLHLDADPAPTLDLLEVVGIEIRHAAAEDGRALASAYPPAEAADPTQAFLQQKFVVLEDGLMQPPTADTHVPVVLKTGGLRPKALRELSGVVVARVLTPPEPVLTVERLLDAKGLTVTGENHALTVVAIDDVPDGRVAVRVRQTTPMAREEVNFAVAVRGRAQNFIRLTREETRVAVGSDGFQLLDPDGKALDGVTTQVTATQSDGVRSTTEVLIRFPRPADKTLPLGLTFSARRSALVELPFTLKDVPVP